MEFQFLYELKPLVTDLREKFVSRPFFVLFIVLKSVDAEMRQRSIHTKSGLVQVLGQIQPRIWPRRRIRKVFGRDDVLRIRVAFSLVLTTKMHFCEKEITEHAGMENEVLIPKVPEHAISGPWHVPAFP
jgi:hypothetical protein